MVLVSHRRNPTEFSDASLTTHGVPTDIIGIGTGIITHGVTKIWKIPQGMLQGIGCIMDDLR